MARGDGWIFKQPRSPFLSIGYYDGNGKLQRECALHVRTGKKLVAAVDAEGELIHDDNYHQAERYLKHRVGEVTTQKHGGPAFVGPAQQRVTVNQILDALVADFKAREIMTPQTDSHLKPIRAEFGDWRAIDLAAHSEAVDKYIAKRREDGYAKATVNRGTQLLGQAYQLAVEHKRLTTVPTVRHLDETGNARKGFFEAAQFRAVVANLPGDLKDFSLFGYLTGWRKGEVASLAWSDVEGDVIRLRAEHAKNNTARSVPIEGELAEIIERRRAARVVKTGDVVVLSDLVFHRNGLAVAEFRKSWATACRLAGVSGKLFHDLRRTAVRDMTRAGTHETVAMSISGHKTRSVFDRYNISSETDRREALRATAEYRQQQTTASKSVSIK